jgi:hypothetical protein
MFTIAKPYKQWSEVGLRVLVASIVAAVALAAADGIMKGPIEEWIVTSHGTSRVAGYAMFSTWIVDFRYLAEQAVYAATIFFVGAKFIETRTVFSVGFDKADTSKVSLKGPDDDNTVWIGYRYGNRLEAESVAVAFQQRLMESAASG